MKVHEKYMKLCIQEAEKGLGTVGANPLVGCVVVHGARIIGRGYHEKYGAPHAEVNAIGTVTQKALLKDTTLYVTLEPCSHHGKTPPCTGMIINSGIRKVVIGAIDTNDSVSGHGAAVLKKAGCEVTTGILEGECREQNRRFVTFIEKKRPYVILKWAQTKAGLFAESNAKQTWITGQGAQRISHRWRAEEGAVMVGTNTAKVDNPRLTCREWKGRDPVRVVLDRSLRLDQDLNLFDRSVPTLVFNESRGYHYENIEYVQLNFGDRMVRHLLSELHKRNIQSVMVEGGKQLLNGFIEAGIWDEARVLVGPDHFKNGITAPVLPNSPDKREEVDEDQVLYYKNY
jgi:diaminohydroxyphosphoribosylaminopyrimidine deaminase/5-amino-6-(5-phosphoribosylamino)uracil reductase